MLNTSWSLEKPKTYPKLSGSAEAEAVIVGGGLAGVLSAYALSKIGKKVILIEKGKLGEGVTLQTTAFLTQLIDTDYSDLIRSLGKEEAGLISDSHAQAIDFIRRIVKAEKIDCEFKDCSYYIYSTEGNDINSLEKEYRALEELNIEADLNPKKDLGINASGCIEIKKQAKFHPLKFISALSEIIVKNGGLIYENTEALKVKDSSVMTAGGEIKAEWIIITTHRPFNRPLGLFFKKATYVSYVLELEMGENNIPEGTYSDMGNPYHYFRMDKNGRVIFGGEDHRADIKMNAEKKFAVLKKSAKHLFKGIDYKVVRRWSGPILESIDGLAYIGRYRKPNTIYAMAFSGNGMTYSGITALIATDIIMGHANSWLKAYNPSRWPNLWLLMVKGRDYMQEMWNGVIRNGK